ncbi:hypothetical protein [Fructilactobacillus carniphilus]|uniref:Uncharacterized protein n=1 Tax=Fructilactobacillus carniphilus TaxID=2940297 RepID=A0ABY5BWI5_9LACO|nr:hypothetical protein [Fructilactobacillus carniphilus]USS90847.1 hypothetical protein M3M37_01060 [Fructilactobacillus carniphilus]
MMLLLKIIALIAFWLLYFWVAAWAFRVDIIREIKLKFKEKLKKFGFSQ